jgi:hypothetical protein
VTDRDPTAAGRAWMCGQLSSEAYFAMVRRQVRAPETGRRRWGRRTAAAVYHAAIRSMPDRNRHGRPS